MARKLVFSPSSLIFEEEIGFRFVHPHVCIVPMENRNIHRPLLPAAHHSQRAKINPVRKPVRPLAGYFHIPHRSCTKPRGLGETQEGMFVIDTSYLLWRCADPQRQLGCDRLVVMAPSYSGNLMLIPLP
jgi:hypothetical protein